MKFSFSNIGWNSEDDEHIYNLMNENGFEGVEIAPTRIFLEKPYENLSIAAEWSRDLKQKNGLVVPSMQSIWFGRIEKLFGSDEEREILLNYTKKAIDFAEAIGCGNLVFGCPRNRSMPEDGDIKVAINFFEELGEYAYNHNNVIALEANPPIYNTNFINMTKDAIDLVEKVNSKGFLLNLDVGTMIVNNENIDILNGKGHLINHIHISEPELKPIQERVLHEELADYLNKIKYQHFVSVEVGRQDDVSNIEKMMKYIKKIFK